MKVVELRDSWSIDGLAVGERPKPVPAPGQVLLKMKAASLNFRDLVMMRGGYGRLAKPLPVIPISDGVGEVVEVGAGVTRFAAGDRVCPNFFQSWISGPLTAAKLASALGGSHDGVMAEYMALDEAGVVRAADHLSDLEAASLPCAALTAWSAIVTQGQVTAGDTVLVQGTGGVSLFALQFAKLLGARVIATSSSDAKLTKVKALGADDVINYRDNPDWGKAAAALTGGRGVDHIVEVGGADTLAQSLRAIAVNGRISLIGVLSGDNVPLPLGPVVTRNIRLQAVTVGSREGFEAMMRAISLHRLRPALDDQAFAFGDLRAALDHLQSGTHFGKICLSFT